MKVQTKPSLENKVDEILQTVTKLAIEFYQFKAKVEPKLVKIDKIDKIENDVAWLVNEYSKLDEDKLPKIKYSF